MSQGFSSRRHPEASFDGCPCACIALCVVLALEALEALVRGQAQSLCTVCCVCEGEEVEGRVK